MPDYPQCLLRMARFRGTTKSEFEDNRQVRANAFTLFQRAQQFLREHLPIASRVQSTSRMMYSTDAKASAASGL